MYANPLLRLTRRFGRLLARSESRFPLIVKVATPVIGATVIMAALLGGVVYNQINTQVEYAYDQQAVAIAAGVQAMFQNANQETRSQIDNYLVFLKAGNPDIFSIRVHALDLGASVIASSDRTELNKTGLVDAAERRAISAGTSYQDVNEGNRLETVAPIRTDGILVGAVVVTSSEARANAAAASMGITLGAATAAAVVLELIFILAFIYLGVLRRIRRLQAAVAAVESGDAIARLPEGSEPPGRDELFNLAHGLDHMIAALQRRGQFDALVRRLDQRALEGAPPPALVAFALREVHDALGLQACIFANTNERGSIVSSVDHEGVNHPRFGLGVWIGALARVAMRSRTAVVSGERGQGSHFMSTSRAEADVHALIVPLGHTPTGGEAIIAVAPEGEVMPDGAVALLDAVAAIIAQAIHLEEAERARGESAVKSRVMAAVSHEMRNPLNSILGFVGLVLGTRSENLTEKQRRQLTSVQTSANNMLTLVNNYLDHAKSQAGSIPIRPEALMLEQAVAEVVEQMQPGAGAKQLQVTCSVQPGATVTADRLRLRQVLTNLISNAVKFTPERGRVIIRAHVCGTEARIAVSDTGVGIPKAQQELVFTEFPKIDAGAMAGAKGSGLGLTLSNELVKAMGGSITFHSRPGRGSTFVVVLPGAVEGAKLAGAA